MNEVRVLVLRAPGINCDEETMYCWRLAGATPRLVHINTLAQHPSMIDDVQIVTLPGGFSYGDDIAAGRILARRIEQDLATPLRALVDRGGGILGICNGFQVLVKMGLLPGSDTWRDQVTVTDNDSARFEARWVRLEVCTDRCPFLTPQNGREYPSDSLAPKRTNTGQREPSPPSHPARRYLEMPIEHAEGRVVTTSLNVVDRLIESGCIAVRYVDPDGRYDTYPFNPNGSAAGMAGLCDSTGRIFGLMPHPDRAFEPTHHPQWTRGKVNDPPDGLTVFQNAVRFWGGNHASFK